MLESVKCVPRKNVFQECLNEALFCDFVVAWISSQLPEQKEGLFNWTWALGMYSHKHKTSQIVKAVGGLFNTCCQI